MVQRLAPLLCPPAVTMPTLPPTDRAHREQLGDDVLGLGADVLPDGVVRVIVAALDLLKQNRVVVVVCVGWGGVAQSNVHAASK